MEEINTSSQTAEQPATPTPEASGEQGNEKLFTQNEVNRIVGERLARAKRDTAADDREQALKAREARLDCREFLTNRQYPAELLDILDTADVEKFKDSVGRLAVLFQETPRKIGTVRVDFGGPLSGGSPAGGADISRAFKPPEI